MGMGEKAARAAASSFFRRALDDQEGKTGDLSKCYKNALCAIANGG